MASCCCPLFAVLYIETDNLILASSSSRTVKIFNIFQEIRRNTPQLSHKMTVPLHAWPANRADAAYKNCRIRLNVDLYTMSMSCWQIKLIVVLILDCYSVWNYWIQLLILRKLFWHHSFGTTFEIALIALAYSLSYIGYAAQAMGIFCLLIHQDWEIWQGSSWGQTELASNFWRKNAIFA